MAQPIAVAGLAFCLVLGGWQTAAADTPPLEPAVLAQATQLRDKALTGSPAYALLESLTSEIGPRLAGTAAEARAIAWAQQRFQSLGYDKVWLEPVVIALWQRRHERARVLGEFEQPLAVTALGHSIGTGGPLQGEVVELADIDALRAVKDQSLQGKIVFISHRMQRARDGSGYSKASEGRADGPAEAARRGAIALLIRSAGTDGHRFPHTGNTRRPADIHQIPSAALSNPDADQLQRLLVRQPDLRLELDLDVGFHGEVTTHNVIAEVTGREHPEQKIVIGAHLDSWDLGTGAIDDGAGVSITMAAGAAIAALPTRPRRSLRVIAFTAEEVGLFGAKSYAADNAALLDQHIVGMESDFGAGRIYALQAGVSPTAQAAVQSMMTVLAPLGIEFDPKLGGPGPDIGPMWEAGVPWMHLKQDGSDYFDYHHTADDTLDKVEPAALDQQVAAYAALSWMLADSAVDLRPAPVKPVKAPACVLQPPELCTAAGAVSGSK